MPTEEPKAPAPEEPARMEPAKPATVGRLIVEDGFSAS